MTNFFDQAKNKFNDQLNSEDKQKNREKACFKSFEEGNMKICDSSGNIITSITETIKKDSSGKYGRKFCLEEFKKLGLHNYAEWLSSSPVELHNSNGIKKILWNPESCFNLFDHHNINLCLKDTNMRCTKYKDSDFNESKNCGKLTLDDLDSCKKQFEKHHSLVVCNTKIFEPFKCFDLFNLNKPNKEGTTLESTNYKFYQNQDCWLIEVNQEKFDELCCQKDIELNTPFCFAFSPASTESFTTDYTTEICRKELAGIGIFPVLEGHTEL